MTRRERIETRLREGFHPITLHVQDDSALHAGHAGAQPAPGQQPGETHYSVTMVSPAFRGQSRVQRSRAVHAVLAAELSSGLHALALNLRAPEETPQQ